MVRMWNGEFHCRLRAFVSCSTPHKMCGSWYLPRFLFRGLLTLMNISSFMVLVIVGRECWDITRTIMEAMFIRVNDPSHRNLGKYQLPHIWDGVLQNTQTPWSTVIPPLYILSIVTLGPPSRVHVHIIW